MKASHQNLIADYEAAEKAFNLAGRLINSPEDKALCAAKDAVTEGVPSSVLAEYRKAQAEKFADSGAYSMFGGCN